jgi:dTDP-4-amino-4,6-dideoxygalactose transaminase
MKKFNRQELRDYLLEKNIQTGLHYQPNHFLDKYFKRKLSLPVTESVFDQIITLPLHPDLNLKDIDYISKTLKDALKVI